MTEEETQPLGDIDKYLPADTETEAIDPESATQDAFNALLHAISLSATREYCIEFSLGGVTDEINSNQLRSTREMPEEDRDLFMAGKAEELYWAESVIIRTLPAFSDET